ncbi:MAG: glutamate--tRNA ligase [Alphaproteobacteria bacterium]
MTVVTRFAPSPTGFLHIGGARTALFNWLFTRHHGGTFRLRIEDTDRKRSTPEAIEGILDGLQWLQLNWDGDTVFQSKNAARHAAIVEQLLESGGAYRCYCSPDELTEMRATAKAEGRTQLYDGRWRDRDPADAPTDVPPVVRVKMPKTGQTVIRDLVQGEVTVANEQLDDFILLRANGTPTYMLSVVVDDHDMDVTHVIRGDDHLNNAFRQYHLFKACGWDVPEFAHIPLIHGPDGAKLSKRHGALGVEAYRDMGYLPEALRNYLLRLGWSHGDDEIISTQQATAWFDLDAVGRGAARMDFAKLESLNGHYIRQSDNTHLIDLIQPALKQHLGDAIDVAAPERLIKGLTSLKERAKTLPELAEAALVYCRVSPLPITPAAAKLLDNDGLSHLRHLSIPLQTLTEWEEPNLEALLREYSEESSTKFGKIAQPLRAALTGTNKSPGIFEVMNILGRDEVLRRIAAVTGQA